MTELFSLAEWGTPESGRERPKQGQFPPYALPPKPGPGNGGQNNHIWIEGEQWQFVKALNPLDAAMKWLLWDSSGTVYVPDKREIARLKGKKLYRNSTKAKWPMIAIAWRQNHVLVDQHDGNWSRVVGLSRDADLDPSKINFQNTPWWVHQVIYINRVRIGRPKGLDIFMPVWNPTGFRYAGKPDKAPTEIWIPRRVLLPPLPEAVAKWDQWKEEHE